MRVCGGKDTKNFVHKGLADVGHAFKVKHHGLELCGAVHDPFGLRARDQLAAQLGQTHRNFCGVKGFAGRGIAHVAGFDCAV